MLHIHEYNWIPIGNVTSRCSIFDRPGCVHAVTRSCLCLLLVWMYCIAIWWFRGLVSVEPYFVPFLVCLSVLLLFYSLLIVFLSLSDAVSDPVVRQPHCPGGGLLEIPYIPQLRCLGLYPTLSLTIQTAKNTNGLCVRMCCVEWVRCCKGVCSCFLCYST